LKSDNTSYRKILTFPSFLAGWSESCSLDRHSPVSHHDSWMYSTTYIWNS